MSNNDKDEQGFIIGVDHQDFIQEDHIKIHRVSLDRLSKAKTSDVQEIAASQIGILHSYNQEVLNQAKTSFRIACVAACVGLIIFLGTLVFIGLRKDTYKSGFVIVSTVGSTFIEFISIINFYLYGKATSQMVAYQKRLYQTQRFLLANSICEGLRDSYKQKARSDLVQSIANIDLDIPYPNAQNLSSLIFTSKKDSKKDKPSSSDIQST